MFGLLKFLVLCLLAVAAGVAAVSLPIEGRTAADHLRALVDGGLPGSRSQARAEPLPEPEPTRGPDRRHALARPARGAGEAQPADAHTEEDRKALDELIGKRVR